MPASLSTALSLHNSFIAPLRAQRQRTVVTCQLFNQISAAQPDTVNNCTVHHRQPVIGTCARASAPASAPSSSLSSALHYIIVGSQHCHCHHCQLRAAAAIASNIMHCIAFISISAIIIDIVALHHCIQTAIVILLIRLALQHCTSRMRILSALQFAAANHYCQVIIICSLTVLIDHCDFWFQPLSSYCIYCRLTFSAHRHIIWRSCSQHCIAYCRTWSQHCIHCIASHRLRNNCTGYWQPIGFTTAFTLTIAYHDVDRQDVTTFSLQQQPGNSAFPHLFIFIGYFLFLFISIAPPPYLHCRIAAGEHLQQPSPPLLLHAALQ